MFTPQAIPDVILIELRRFEDARGYFNETYSAERYRAGGVAATFVQDNLSLSGPAGALRGLHFQAPPMEQAKLVTCVAGAIFDVAVDIRAGSPTFGRHVAVELSAANCRQLYVPAGFAHGFCTLLPDTLVTYKASNLYAAASDRGLAWNDPALGIKWPLPPSGPVLSDRDQQHPKLADLPKHFR
jgi:dTDP-4-dehydrorhamnose 3,5-epimerase